jgi:ABC-type glycerol-3-phosphate transport system substrate-binding protein
MKRTVVMLLLLLFALCIWAGGQQDKEAPSGGASAFEGMTVDVMYMATGGHTDTGKLVGEFEAKYGVKVNFTMIAPAQYDAKLDTELIPKTGAYDAVWLPWRTFHRWVAADWIEPMDALLADANLVDQEQLDLKGFFPPAVSSLQVGGKQYALPSYNDGAIFAYRSDLYQAAGLGSAPDTGQQVREYAAKLHSKEVAGYAMRASKSGGCAGWMVPMLLRAWGGGVVKDYPNDWRGNLTSPESMAALEWYVDIMTKYTFDGGLTACWMEIVPAYTQGKVAQVPEAWVLMGQVLEPEKSVVYDKTAFAIPPRGPATRIASGAVHGLGIPANSPEKELGYKFIEWVLSEHVQRRNVVENKSTAITRPKIMAEAAYVESFEYGGKQFVQTVQESLDKYVNALFRPMSPKWREVEEQLGIAISSVLTGQQQLMPAMEKANKEITRIHQEAGY